MKQRLFTTAVILLLVGSACTMPFPFSMSQLVPATSSQLPSISFGGKVAKGQSFEMDIGRKLTFRLIYSAGDGGGWTIWVGDKTQLDEDFSAYVTPPYRGPNSRDIEGWDFKRAELSDLQKIRRFYFVLNRSDYQFATDSLRKLMWPYEFSDMEVKQAYEARIALPKASGTLTITNMEIENLMSSDYPRISSMEFAVNINLQPMRVDLP